MVAWLLLLIAQMLLSVLVSGVLVLIQIITDIKCSELSITLNLTLICHLLCEVASYQYWLLMYESDQLYSRKKVSIFFNVCNRDVEAGPFSVKAEVQKIYRFQFHIGYLT